MSSIFSMAAHALLALVPLADLAGCANTRTGPAGEMRPISERELALRKLQAPLEQHLCKIAIYPSSRQDWQLQRIKSFSGRGKTFEAALEALCREVEGHKLPAVVDIFFARAPSGWSPTYEVRGTAVRFEDGFTPPQAPEWNSIRAPEMPANLDVEPPPAGEGGKTSARHRGRRAGLIDQGDRQAARRSSRNNG